MYDFDKIGISSRHLSFFETLVFGYAGAPEILPKQEAVKVMFDLMINQLNLDKARIFVTTLGRVEAEQTKLDEKEDEDFYRAWVNCLGEAQVARTNGRRNLFYSRVIGNPGGTGCEIYYLINGHYIEIGSQVNYKFKFTGGLERMRNQAILQGFGFERLLMALEDTDQISETSLILLLKNIIRKFLEQNGDKTVGLYDENLSVIADHLRAISFIIFDGQKLDTSARGKILRDFIKNLHSQFVYLGVSQSDEMELIDKMFTELCRLFRVRYPELQKVRSLLKDTVLKVI